jgi:WD40 repeat protein
MPTPDSPRPPYPGLRPFEADEADLFFGREEHADALLERLSGSHLVAVVGESGAGKSSLVRAGLLPALEAGFVVEAGSDWRVAVMRPGGWPLAALADALLAPGVLHREGAAGHREFALAELRKGPLGLARLVRDAHLDRYCNTLIVVDQFEELFRYCREPVQKDQANVFVELLLHASRQRQVPIFVVLTMRSDFVGDCARFRGLPEALNDNQYLTPRLTREQIAAAIREPARVCGGSVDPDLVDELCNAVGDDQDQLPLLQHLLMRAWDRAGREAPSPRLTAELSRDIGGLRFALNNHAQQVYDELALPRQSVARALFKTLTEPRSQRRDLRRDALVSEVAAIAGADVTDVIGVADRFRANGCHMLMPPPQIALDAASRLDISHESLLRQWSSLADWAREEGANAREFDRLREEARLERDQEGELLSGRDLARALDWKRQADPTPAWAERYASAGELDATLAFITKSEEESRRKRSEEQRAAKEAAAARRARIYTALSGGALVLATVVAFVIFNLWRQADRDRNEAIRQTALAEVHRRQAEDRRAEALANEIRANRASLEIEAQRRLVEERNVELAKKESEAHVSRLTANARLELTRDVPLALLLAREAVLEGTSDPAAVRTLRDALTAYVPSIQARFRVATSRNFIPGTGKGAWLDFSLGPLSVSGQDLVITPAGNDAVIWSAVTGQVVRTLKGHTDIVAAAAFSPDGRLAVTASADHTARLWETSTGRVLQRLPHELMVNAAVFNRDGTLLVTLGDDNLAQVWDVRDGATLRCPLRQSGNFVTGSFSEDLKLLATMRLRSWDRWQGDVWDLSRPGCPRVSVPAIDSMTNLKWASFSERGRFLGVVATDGSAIVLTAPDWKERLRHVPPTRYRPRDARALLESLPPPLAWSHDDRFVATAGADNTVYLLSLAGDPRPTMELRGHTGLVTSMAFGPDDDRLVTSAADNTARIWTFGTDRRVLERLVLTSHKDTVGSAVFSVRGDRVITASDDGTARSWTPLFALRDLIKAAEPSDKRLIRGAPASSALGQIKGVWASELATTALAARQEELKKISGTSTLGVLRIVEPTKDAFIVRELGGSGSRYAIDGSPANLLTMAVSPNGRFVVVRTEDSATPALWDLSGAPKQERLTAPVLSRPCLPKAIFDDRRVAWYCGDVDIVMISRPGEPSAVRIHVADHSNVEWMRFSASGRWLAMTLDDDSVRVVDTRTGAGRPPMSGHDGWINSLDFSDDDRYLVSAGDDATARVWEVASGIELAMMNLPELMGAVFHGGGALLLFSPDRLVLWRCYACHDQPGLLREVRQRQVVRLLAPEEKVRYGLESFVSARDQPAPSRHSHVAPAPRR